MSRKTYVWDEQAKKLVDITEYVNAPREPQTQLMVGRHYENVRFTDGKVVKNRREYNEYMRRGGYTHMSDFKGTWEKAAQDRAARVLDGGTAAEKKERKEQLNRALYEVYDSPGIQQRPQYERAGSDTPVIGVAKD